MPAENRAAQFAPFAALTGYDEEIREVCRFTDFRMLPGEDLQAELERKLNLLYAAQEEHPPAKLLCFLPDKTKEGGSFQTVKGNVLAIEPLEGLMILTNGTQIPIAHVCEIESPLFEREEL